MVSATMRMNCCVLLAILVAASAAEVDRNIRRRLQACTTPPTLSTVHIVSVFSGLVLKANTGGSVVQSFPSTNANDNWKFQSVGGGLYRVMNESTKGALSGTCAQ
jgi:Ricin-type beta-trefoil lectin domain-like